MNQITPPAATDPTLEGFTAWVYAVMGVPQSALPSDSIYLQLAYDESVNLTYFGLQAVPNTSPQITYTDNTTAPPTVVTRPRSPSIYSIAVYNLGGHILVTTAADDPNGDPPTFWSDLRTTLGMNSMSLGLVTSASDQGTSAGQMIPSQIQDLTLMGLDLLKTPWGRRYMQIAGQWGTLWGIS